MSLVTPVCHQKPVVSTHCGGGLDLYTILPESYIGLCLAHCLGSLMYQEQVGARDSANNKQVL